MEFLSYLITGIGLGSIYAIIALGYTMVYGIAKMLNFAHGDVIMVGAYVSFYVTMFAGSNLLGEDPSALTTGAVALVSVLLAMVVCTVLGVVIEGLAYRPLRQAGSLAVLITAIGVSYFLQNAAQLLFGAINAIVSSFGVFDIAVSVAGMPSPNYAGHTIVAHLYDYAFIRFQMGYASAVAVVLFVMTFLLGKVVMRLLSSKDE